MKKALVLAGMLAWALCSIPSLDAGTTGPKKLTVYMARGKDAASKLDDPDFRDLLTKGIFAAHSIKIDLTSGQAAFLGDFFEADLVYLSLHSNPNVWVVPNGDRVDHLDVIQAHKAAGRAPKLVIVSGCSTIGTGTKVNFPAALGVQPTALKKAYIGFATVIPGVFCDRYFREFLAHWLKPRPDGSYRTLEEARVDSQAFIQRQLTLQGPGSGPRASFAPLDATIANRLTIVGDSDLRVTDL